MRVDVNVEVTGRVGIDVLEERVLVDVEVRVEVRVEVVPGIVDVPVSDTVVQGYVLVEEKVVVLGLTVVLVVDSIKVRPDVDGSPVVTVWSTVT